MSIVARLTGLLKLFLKIQSRNHCFSNRFLIVRTRSALLWVYVVAVLQRALSWANNSNCFKTNKKLFRNKFLGHHQTESFKEEKVLRLKTAGKQKRWDVTIIFRAPPIRARAFHSQQRMCGGFSVNFLYQFCKLSV